MPEKSLGFLRSFLKWSNLLILVFLGCFLYFPKNAQANPANDSMLGYWKFDGNTTDFSGDGCTGGTLNGGANYTTDKAPTTQFLSSQSMSFVGNNGCFINGFANESHLQPTSGLTFSTWVYLNGNPSISAVVGGNYELGYNHGFHLQIDQLNNQIYFLVGNAPTGGGLADFLLSDLAPYNTWHHIVGTWDGASTVSIYLDGTFKKSASFAGPISYASPGGTFFRLGQGLNGSLDDVRLYNRALTATEISDLAAGNHTTSSWISTASTDYNLKTNWSQQAVPDPYTKVNITGITSYPIFSSSSESMAGLYIDVGSKLDIGSYDLTLNDGGAFENNGTLVLKNYPTQHLYNLVNDTNSGTVRIDGFTSANELKAGNSYYNLVFAGTANFVLSNDLIVNGNLSFESGALDASTSNRAIIVKKNWLKSSGTFIPGNSTVSLSGLNQSISGSNTFYNLQKSVSTADILTFQSNSTQTIIGNLLLQGAGSASQFLSLRSSTTGAQWGIDPQGNRDVSGVDVKDSNNINLTPIALGGLNVDSGNNTNWTFNTTSGSSPLIVLSPYDSPTSNTRPSIKGKATASNASISSVEFRLGTTSTTWQACTASDGTFNSEVEDFACRPTSFLADGKYTMYTRATDTGSNTTNSSSYPSASFRIDTSPPDVSSVSDDPDAESAKITWDTDENSSSRVEYGKSSTYGKSSSESENVKDHSITVKDLSICTEYHYKVKSKDAAGNEGKSSDHTFKTVGCSTASSSSSSASSSSTDSSDTSSAESNTQTTATNTGTTQNIPSASSAANTETKTDFNESTSPFWQAENFGSSYCFNEKVCGGSADPDGDGVSNSDEYRLGTNPNSSDTDKDGTSDSTEIEGGRDPTKSSQDQNGDLIVFEDPKENGTIAKEKYEVENIEVVESGGKKKLQISGKGPPNTYVTVYVYSDPIVLTVKTDSDGNWSYILDQDLLDGQHEVYVAVTNNAGKISEKSNPLLFIKTAEAVTIIPPAEAAAGERAESPTEAWYKGGIFLFISIVVAGLILALASIGIYKHRMSKQSDTVGPEQNS